MEVKHYYVGSLKRVHNYYGGVSSIVCVRIVTCYTAELLPFIARGC